MVITGDLMGFSFLVAVWQLRPGPCTAAGQCFSGLLWSECWFWVENRQSAIFVDRVIPGEVGLVGGPEKIILHPMLMCKFLIWWPG